MLANLLVQVCQREFVEYTNSDQEVLIFSFLLSVPNDQAFAIQVNFKKVTLWYAHFPIDYLRAIRHLGVQYRTQFPHTHGVELRCTESWDMDTCQGRVELFQHLSKMIFYLKSGNSLVGYMRNYPENPLHWVYPIIILLILDWGQEGDDRRG